MTTVTDKELIKEIKERIGSLDVRDNIERRAYEIALASLEAEPVAWQVTITKDGQDSASIIYRDCAEKDTWVRIHETLGSVVHVTPLYMAPPAPVIQADVAQAIENLRQKLVECNRYNYCADAVKGVEDACHATMLQGSQPVSQTYNLPELIEGMEVSIDVSTCDADLGNRYFGTVTEALELDTAKNGYILLVQDAEPNFDVNGNSPGTPDSWISCSERMPEKGQNVLISVNIDSEAGPLIYSARYIGSTFRRGGITVSPGNALGQATHWMPLPAPPQEVNRG